MRLSTLGSFPLPPVWRLNSVVGIVACCGCLFLFGSVLKEVRSQEASDPVADSPAESTTAAEAAATPETKDDSVTKEDAGNAAAPVGSEETAGPVGMPPGMGGMSGPPAPPPPPFTNDEITKKVADAANIGHNAWMMTSAALVLFMTAPGLAMFYGGLVRKKNVLGVMMQCVFLMGLMTVIWALYGYSLSFGGDIVSTTGNGIEDASAANRRAALARFIGSTDHVLMNNVGRSIPEGKEAPETPFEGKIPRPTHMLFQGMFFIITPALICGAFAERMKFSSMVLFMILWGTIVYCPLCHWVWDGGILAYRAPGNPMRDSVPILGGSIDFAGGTVVHISSGVSALLCCMLLGKRHGFNQEPMPPHNLTYTVLGAGMLWVGWFGFNAGSALASDDLAAHAFMTTHLSAAAGTLAWAGIEWIIRGKPSALGAASGAVAGLVCITPAAGYVGPMPALLMGALAGLVCFFACSKLKSALGYDDSLDAFGVHGVGGTLGAILTGVFATVQVTDPGLSEGKPLGLVDGGATHLLIGQIAAVAVTWCLAFAATFVILKVVDLTLGLRVSREDEQQGLDVSQHGEEGYIFL